jgi:general secretion pathway protein B
VEEIEAMSYILDALKKAEQERGISRTPVLSAGHADQNRNRGGWLILGCALVVCLAGIALVFLSSREKSPHGSAIPSRSVAPVVAENRPPTSAIVPSEPIQPSVAQPVPESPAANRRPGRIQAPADTTPAPVPQESGSRVNAPVPEAREDSTVNPNSVPASSSMRSGPEVQSAMPSNTQSPPASLREAMSKMAITILLYSETPAERIVFINGKKYVEGDSVDGLYLLEKITADGAVLSHKGERLLLRPK